MEMTVREFIQNYEKGMYADTSRKTMIAAGWYDWFCDDSALKDKLDNLFPKVKQIANSKKIDMDRMYVFFKNNCPCAGALYDDFRFCDLKTGDVIYSVIPASGHESSWGQAELWGRENGFDKALVEGTWKDIEAFFGIEKRGPKEYRTINEWLEDQGQPLAAVHENSVAVLEHDLMRKNDRITVYNFTESKDPFSGEMRINVGSGWCISSDHFGSLKKLLNSMETMENLIQKRNAARERHNQMKKEFLLLIGTKTGIEFEFELEALLNAAYDWGLYDGAIATGKGEVVI